jgi:hypothetical protein
MACLPGAARFSTPVADPLPDAVNASAAAAARLGNSSSEIEAYEKVSITQWLAEQPGLNKYGDADGREGCV